MKKFFTVAASLILSAAMLTACGSSAAPAATTGAPETTAAAVTQAPETTEETKSFHIAIVQQLDHASLDEIRSTSSAICRPIRSVRWWARWT